VSYAPRVVRPESQSLDEHGDEAAPQLDLRTRHEQVAALIRGGIRVGRFKAGERLPSERRLAEQLGVGRASVREAIGALQLHGLITTRQGAGSYVADDALAKVHASSLTPGAGATSPSALLDARNILEPSVAALAAERAKADPTIDRLLEQMERSGDPTDQAQRSSWSEADRVFHRQIAALAGNEILLAFAEQIAAMMDEPLWKQLRDDSIAVPGRTRVYMAEHRMIYEAILTGDVSAAEFYAREHLKRVRRYMDLQDQRDWVRSGAAEF
jgi:DNA-binding FadR family transcriptional regulator